MVVADPDVLSDPYASPLDAADAYPSDIIVVVDGGHQQLQVSVLVTLRRLYVIYDRLKERFEILSRHFVRIAGGTASSGAEQHRTVKLLFAGSQVQQQFKDLIHDFMHPCVRAVDLVDHHDKHESELQRLRKHEAGLRHGSLRGVHQQEHAVGHLQDALDFSSEVRVSRGVYDVYLYSVIGAGAVL